MLSCRGGDTVQASLSCPPPTWVSKGNYFAKSTYFKLSICEDVSIINIIQVKFSCFFVAFFRMLSCRGGGQAVQASLSCVPSTWVSK